MSARRLPALPLFPPRQFSVTEWGTQAPVFVTARTAHGAAVAAAGTGVIPARRVFPNEWHFVTDGYHGPNRTLMVREVRR